MSSPSALRAFLATLLAGALVACGGADPLTAPTPPSGDATAVAAIGAEARPIVGDAADYDPLLALVGDARVVLLGESTHGTHEFYRERARITQRLVRELGFGAVAIEGDQAEAARVNEYVRAMSADASPEQALGAFTRFPRWMWANADVRDLVQWMRAYDDAQPAAADVGFYGLDVQSLSAPAATLLRWLDRADPAAAARTREHLACLDEYGGNALRYGSAVAAAPAASCQSQVALVVEEVRERARPAEPLAAESLFAAVRSAEAIAGAEEYFRVQYAGGGSAWDVRDRRMAEGLEALEAHLAAVTGRAGKVVVWVHNTHAGDARATEGAEGGLNLGQLARERLGAAAVNVGFLTHRGTVFAAPAWASAGQPYALRPAADGSFSALLHDVVVGGAPGAFLLALRGGSPAAVALETSRLERAVGVVYAPETELQSHYFSARLSRQFDAVVFLDSTSAVRPLAF